MTRKRSISRALLADVIKRLMANMEDPAFDALVGSVHGAEHELDDIDALLERLASEKTTPEAGTHGAAAPTLPACGTKPVSIRIHNRVINAFKAEAARTGTPYQTLMHRSLADAADELAV